MLYTAAQYLDILSAQTRGFVSRENLGDFMQTSNAIKKNRRSLSSISLVLAGVTGLAAPVAWASKTSIDFNEPTVFGASTGLSMPLYSPSCTGDALNGAIDTSCSLDLTGNGFAEVALGFDLTIDGTTYSNVFINENGFVTFGAGASSAAQNSTSFAGLQSALGTTSFLAPAVADFTTGTSTPFDFGNGGTGVYYQRGMGVLGAGPYVDNDPRATDAFNVIWSSNVGGSRFVSQLLLYSLGSGGFAAQFNYGDLFGDANPTLAGGFGGYSVGAQSVSFGNQFDDNLAAYRFGAGGGDPPPVGVPEPGVLVLMLTALLGVIMVIRRRPVVPA
jgi:hypothetical protein